MTDITRTCEHCGKEINLKTDVWWRLQYGTTPRGFPIYNYLHDHCKKSSNVYDKYLLMGEEKP